MNRSNSRTKLVRGLLALLALSVCLESCGSAENKRIRELMHEKGFGSRAQGDATRENYVAGGDGVLFFMDPYVYTQADAERLYFLTLPQNVGLDGTILIPYVGPVQVLGKTEAELSRLVKNLLRPYFDFEISLEARIVDRGKAFYALGEAGAKGRLAMTKGDLTLVEAVMTVGWTPLGNLGRVYLIRPDAENPLVMVVNFREMVLTGLTARNFQLRDNDIIYIPPTFLGAIARFLERLLLPLGVAVNTLLGVATVRYSYDIVTGAATGGAFYRF